MSVEYEGLDLQLTAVANVAGFFFNVAPVQSYLRITSWTLHKCVNKFYLQTRISHDTAHNVWQNSFELMLSQIRELDKSS
jgi:hypothetical protein